MSETETTVVFETKIIVDANLGVFIAEVVAQARDGWELDPTTVPGMYGFLYEAQMRKDSALIDNSPTRADILANARSAKKIKAEKAAEPEKSAE